MTILLREDYVGIEPIYPDDKVSDGGILIKTGKETRPTQGIIRFVGPGKMLDDGSRKPMDLSVGYKVSFEPGREDRLMVDDVEIFRMQSQFVRCIHTVDTE